MYTRLFYSLRILVAGVLLCTLAQSCSSGKQCGCGSNINNAYRPRHFR